MKPIFRAILDSGEILEIYAEMVGTSKRLYVKGPFHIGPGKPIMREITEWIVTADKVTWTVRSSGGELHKHEVFIKGF